MPKLASAATLLIGIMLMAFCGSELSHRIGLHGFDQWPIIGFALGLLLLSYAGVAELRERVKRLEDRAAEKPRTT